MTLDASEPRAACADPSPGPAPTDPSLVASALVELLRDPRRVAEVEALAPGVFEPNPAVDRLTRLAAELLDAPVAQISVLDLQQHVVSAFGFDPAAGAGALEESLCSITAGSGAPFVVTDAAKDPIVAALPPVAAGVVRAYCGVPLRLASGAVIGALCVYDSVAREFLPEQVELLGQIAASATTEIELRATTLRLGAASARLDRIATAAGLGGWEYWVAADHVVWDDEMYRLFGFEPTSWGATVEEFVGRLHPGDRDRTMATLRRSIDECCDYDVEYRVRLGPGRWRWIRAWGRGVAGSDGTTERVVGVATDTTRLRSVRDLAARSLEHMTDGFYVLDTDDRFIYVNPVIERMARETRGELLGASVWTIVPEEFHELYRSKMAEARRTADSVSFERYETVAGRWYEVRFLPAAEGLSVYVVDITERKQIEQERTELLARKQTVADALQAAVLPQRLPELDEVSVAARYRPSDVDIKVGGDWYDAFVLGGTRLHLAVGDVVGHGLPAASVMGQLRNSLRAFALLGKGPGRLLRRLNELLANLEPDAMATVWVGELDLRSGRLVWSSAGHPPVMIRRANGSVERLGGRPNLPVGVAPVGVDLAEHVADLLPGDLLLAYTDGLVERREETIDDGLDRLAAHLGTSAGTAPEPLLAELLASLLGGRTVDDDVCVLALELRGYVRSVGSA